MGTRAQPHRPRTRRARLRSARVPAGRRTALAARWRHRDSFDIDLVVDRTVPLSELANPSNPFDFKMRALGGTSKYFRRQCTESFPSGQVDLLQVDPVPPGAEHLAVVDGTPTFVLDTAQKLHGKLERADKVAVRDVFTSSGPRSSTRTRWRRL